MAQSKQKIGWIGMGRMGFPMAERLLKAGYDVSVWNRTRAKAEPLAKIGGQVVDNLMELKDVDVLFSIVSNGKDLDQAMTLVQRAKQQAPNNDDITDTMGLIYVKKKLTDNAVTLFTDLVKKQPKNALYHYHLGMAQLQKGNRATARQSLQTALQLKPAKQDEARIRELMQSAS